MSDLETAHARIAELEKLVWSLAEKLATASAHLTIVAERENVAGDLALRKAADRVAEPNGEIGGRLPAIPSQEIATG